MAAALATFTDETAKAGLEEEFTALNTAFAELNRNVTTAVYENDTLKVVASAIGGVEVETGNLWATAADIATFEAAYLAFTTINDEQTNDDTVYYSLAEYQEAYNTFETAWNAFYARNDDNSAFVSESQVQYGMEGKYPAVLRTAIDAAEALVSATPVSTVNGDDIATTDEWVTQAVQTALNSAITTAEARHTEISVDNTTISGIIMQGYIDDINDAIDTFNNAKQDGTGANATALIDFKTTLENAYKAIGHPITESNGIITVANFNATVYQWRP